jgi:large subunit ribosomal protein L20
MRAKNGSARNKRKKRLFRKVKGFVGGRRRLLRSAKETLLRAGMFAFRDRRAKKRDFRKLFIIRLSAAAEMRGLRYSRLIHGLRLAKISLDRKSLSELAIHDPETFDAIVAKIRTEIDKHDAEVKARQKAKTAWTPRAPRGTNAAHEGCGTKPVIEAGWTRRESTVAPSNLSNAQIALWQSTSPARFFAQSDRRRNYALAAPNMMRWNEEVGGSRPTVRGLSVPADW